MTDRQILQKLGDIGYELAKRCGVGEAYMALFTAEKDSEEYKRAMEELMSAAQIDYMAVGRKAAE